MRLQPNFLKQGFSKRVLLRRTWLAGAALLCAAQGAAAQNFNQVIGFGDSTVDTGWYTGASSGPHSTGNAGMDAQIAASLAAGGNAHPTGPGLGNTQLLAGFFGLTVNSASQPGGTNYALGNAVDFLDELVDLARHGVKHVVDFGVCP